MTMKITFLYQVSCYTVETRYKCRSLVFSVSRGGGGGLSGHQEYRHYAMRDTVDFNVHFMVTLFKQQVTQNQKTL